MTLVKKGPLHTRIGHGINVQLSLKADSAQGTDTGYHMQLPQSPDNMKSAKLLS